MGLLCCSEALKLLVCTTFDQHTTIRSNVHSVLMEKLWWTYPSTNRLVPFKDIVDADADADEEVSLEVSLGDDVPVQRSIKSLVTLVA